MAQTPEEKAAAKAAKDAEKAAAKAAKDSADGFQVLDANGAPFRIVADEAEAKELAAHVGGSVQT